MCSLRAFLFLAGCHASKKSLLFHLGPLSITVTLSRSSHVSSACLAKKEFRSRVAMALECSRFLILKARDVCPR